MAKAGFKETLDAVLILVAEQMVDADLTVEPAQQLCLGTNPREGRLVIAQIRLDERVEADPRCAFFGIL